MTHGVFVVLHDDQAVALGTEVLQHFQELVVIPRVEPDTRLVQNVKHPLESSPYGTGQADSLGLAATQGRSLAADVQVAKANRLQEIQATPDFAEDFLAYPQFLFGKFQAVEKVGGLIDGPIRQFRDMSIAALPMNRISSSDE